jgi:hypothetical protein
MSTIETKTPSYPWLPAALIVGGALALFNWITSQGEGTTSTAYWIGVALGQAVLGWMALLLTGLQRAGVRGVGGAFLVIWLVAFFGIAPANAPTQSKVGEPALSGKIAEMREAVREGRLVSVAPVEQRVGGKSERELAVEFNNRVLNAIMDQRNGYLAEIKAIGWETILDADRLYADNGMVETAQMLAQAEDAAIRSCESYREKSEASARRVAAEIGASAAMQKELLEGFMAGMERGAPVAEEICRIEMALLQEFEGAMLILQNDRDWVVENGSIMFMSAASLENFNGHLTRIQAMTAEQAKLQDDSLKRGQELLERAGM